MGVILALVLAGADASAACPTPRVRIERAERISGDEDRGDALGVLRAVGQGVVDALSVSTTEVRLVDRDEDFVLHVGGTATRRGPHGGGAWAFGHEGRLVDGRGRVVASGSVSYRAAADDEAIRRAASGLARQLSPLDEAIHAHQHRVRSQEASAMGASLSLAVDAGEVPVGATQGVSLALVDCDGTPLGDRPVALDLDGVGLLDRAHVVTDALGRSEVRFTATAPGVVRITAAWPHADTDGDRRVASAELTLHARDR